MLLFASLRFGRKFSSMGKGINFERTFSFTLAKTHALRMLKLQGTLYSFLRSRARYFKSHSTIWRTRSLCVCSAVKHQMHILRSAWLFATLLT